jgi:hypothetical protein
MRWCTRENPPASEDFIPSIGREYLNVDIVRCNINAEDEDALKNRLGFTGSGDIRGPTTFAGPDCTSLEAWRCVLRLSGQVAGRQTERVALPPGWDDGQAI